MRSLALISSFLIGSAAFAQVPAQDWRFAHPGATLVGGFRLKAVLDSPLVNTVIAQATTKDPSAGMMVGMMRSTLGGVTEVRFSVRDMGKGKDPDMLALVTGVMDEAIVSALTQGKTQGKTTVRRIDANTMLDRRRSVAGRGSGPLEQAGDGASGARPGSQQGSGRLRSLAFGDDPGDSHDADSDVGFSAWISAGNQPAERS